MRLKEILLRSHTVDAATWAQAEQMSTATGAPIVHILVRYRVVEGRRMARLLSRACHVELIDVAAIDVHKRLLEVVPRHAAEQLRVLPIGVKKAANGERLYLAMSDPSDDATVDVVEKATGRSVEVMCCDDEALAASLDRHYGPVARVDEPAVVVGALDARGEFLTESTAEALRLVQSVRSADLPTLSPLDFSAHPSLGDEQTVEVVRQQRPASVALTAALAEVTADTARGSGRTSLPTMQEVWGNASAPTSVEAELDGVPDEPLFDEPRSGRGPAQDPLSILPPSSRVIVSTPPALSPSSRAELLSELLDLLGAVDLDDDAVAACKAASKARALVLLAPRPQSALLRALLDLEERQPRPRIVVLGGDPALRMLAFVDHHADLPDVAGAPGARGVAVAVMVALRQAGVRL